MTTRLVASILLLSFSFAGFARDKTQDAKIESIEALSSDIAFGEYLANECSACHNANGGANGIPVLKGQNKKSLIRALLEYQDEKRPNKTMQLVANALNNEEIGALATFFSSQ